MMLMMMLTTTTTTTDPLGTNSRRILKIEEKKMSSIIRCRCPTHASSMTVPFLWAS